MKISQLNCQTVKDYLRITSKDEDVIIETILSAATQYVKSNTGLDDAALDGFEDITVALLILCADMYDNRQMQVATDKQNPVVEKILALHCINYL